MGEISHEGRGIVLNFKGLRIGLDCNKGDINFLSHAHADHIFKRGSNVISSEETLAIAKERFGANLSPYEGENFGYELLDAGHVLGSKAILFDDGKERVVYTGDFSLKSRHFLKGFKPPKADVLVMDATFSSSDFVFPEFRDIVSQSADLIGNVLDNGGVPCLIGYSFGKAQHLTLLSRRFGKPIFVTEKIQKMNDMHQDFGVRIKGYELSDGAVDGILVSEKRVNGAYNIGYSGWAVNKTYMYSHGFRAAFPLSDHGDFNETVVTAKKVNPEKIYLLHNNSSEIADVLRHEGFIVEQM